MTQAASQATKFYNEVSRTHKLWTITRDEIFPTVENPDGNIVVPFWSSLSRVERIINNVKIYAGSEPFEITWEELWVPDLNKRGWLVGVNWSGEKALGYDLEPDLVVRTIDGRF